MRKRWMKCMVFIGALAMVPGMLLATDDGPRMYWNAPVGTNILQAYFWTATGNSVTPENSLTNPYTDTDINIGVLGYNRIVDVGGHAAIVTAVLTGGRVSGDISYLGQEKILRASSGIGDLYFQGVINLFGAPALSAEAFADYRQETVLSLLVGVTAPTGDYEANRLLNLGMNRWNLRVGLPFVQTLGEWIPGGITTLEILPSVWFYGDNDDSLLGATLTQDPMYTLEAHITRDLTPEIFVSLDYFVQRVGKVFYDGVPGADAHTSDSLGVTIGYMLNAQTQFQLRYAGTLNPDAEQGELEAKMLQFNLNYFW